MNRRQDGRMEIEKRRKRVQEKEKEKTGGRGERRVIRTGELGRQGEKNE